MDDEDDATVVLSSDPEENDEDGDNEAPNGPGSSSIQEIIGPQNDRRLPSMDTENAIDDNIDPATPRRSTQEATSTAYSAACQTTPSLSRCDPNTPVEDKDYPKEIEEDNAEEDQGCPICFEPWSNSGPHRLASLTCGHLFGRSCIERWLKGKNVDKCPQCNHPAKRKDLRNIYCKSIKAIDTADRDKALKELEEERTRRSKAEQEKARAILQYELAKAEIQMLKHQIKEQGNNNNSERKRLETGAQSSDRQKTDAAHDDRGKRFVHEKTMPISQNKARIMAYDYCHGTLAISKPSPNRLFPGYGVVKISSLETRSSEYVSIHQQPIRDASFSCQGDLLLSSSVDKTLKMTSMSCNSVVQTYTCPSPVWACAWNTEDPNYVYGGLHNGSCLVFDLRNTTTFVKDAKPPDHVVPSRPIVSMTYVSPQSTSDFSPQGLLIGTLAGGYFLENTEADYLPYALPFPEGSCTCLSFDDASRRCMLSQRPSKAFPKTRHLVYSLTGSGIGGQLTSSSSAAAAAAASSSRGTTVCSCHAVQQCVGGSMNKLLARSALFSYPDDDGRLFACAGDESTCTAVVWNAITGTVLHKIPTQATDQVVDVLAFTANNCHFLGCITERKLTIHKWTTGPT